jgi:hypothetical protein
MKYYKKTYDDSSIVKVEDNLTSFIPKDPANTDYQEYLAWVAEGNEAEEWSAE